VFCALRIAIFAHVKPDATRLCTPSERKGTRNERKARGRRNDDAFIIER
jgi:hypothetical protein